MLLVMRDSQTAPGRLELVRTFVNSRDIEEDTDELADTDSALAWMREQGMVEAGGDLELSEADRKRLVAVRERLREMLLANNTKQPPPRSTLDALNERAGDLTLRVRFDPDASELLPAERGVDGALAELLAIVHAAIGDGSWGRLKACLAADCQWAFYDRSRNRSATWCQMGACGNRSKARAFRARQQGQSADGDG
jgi:predicted RNA-binding Zn ribbon-like protein